MTGMSSTVLRSVMARLRPAPIANVGAFKEFLKERALLVAQKCAIDYCRGKTGLASYALFTEEPFLKALDVCRWETFAAVLGDLLILGEGHLRPQAGAERRLLLCDALLRLHADVLDSAAPPPHRTQGWDDVITALAARLQASRIDLEEGFERPVDVQVGPDGLVYVLDFGVFNPSEKTMKVFPKTGRVYRIEPVTAQDFERLFAAAM